MRKGIGFNRSRSSAISATFTVYFDGQFWVGVAERASGEKLEARRIVFGAEPSDEKIYRFVLKQWNRLKFSAGIDAKASGAKQPSNPKRRQREAAKEAARARPSTKAQQALALEREARKLDARHQSAAKTRELARARYSQRREKHKNKHRGR